MVLIKEIELSLKPQNTDVVAQEDDILADSVLELANADFSKQDDYEEVTPGFIRKHVEADMRVAYPGKPTSRKRMFKGDNVGEQLLRNELDGSIEDEAESEEANSELNSENDDDQSPESNLEEEEEDDDSEDGDESSDFGGSIAGFQNESKLSETEDDEQEGTQGIDIFSARARDIQQDIEKGKSIRNQLTIWEKLIECRIKMQPALIGVNKLFQCDELKEFKGQINSEEDEIICQTYSVLSDLMKRLLELQDITLNGSPEYKEIKDLKRKNNSTIKDEPEEKKHKSTDFLQELHNDFKPFMNSVIQKWNEKTRLSHGKMSKSDFSVFDQPTLKQIEEILLDRERLLKRTRTKRSDYQVLGKFSCSVNENSSKVRDLQEYDPEIFDDDDFYHKLLRDFIENKTSDTSDVSKRGKQWLELQKLRSRMKAKVDTRASKGRKIRFTVHNKMVNFMAPIPSYSWTDDAKNELFKSLFGQTLQQKKG